MNTKKSNTSVLLAALLIAAAAFWIIGWAAFFITGGSSSDSEAPDSGASGSTAASSEAASQPSDSQSADSQAGVQQPALLLVRQNVYDAGGMLIRQGNYTYDASGTLTREDWSDASYIEYDPYGNVNVNSYYDANGVLQQEVYQHTYDTNGNVLQAWCYVNNTLTRTDTYTYNSIGKWDAKTAAYPDGSSWTVQYSYDASGNLMRETYSNGKPDVVYTYDAAGNLLTDGTYAYEYDAAGNLTKQTRQSDGYYYTFQYDGNGNLLQMSCYTAMGTPDGYSTYEYGAQ